MNQRIKAARMDSAGVVAGTIHQKNGEIVTASAVFSKCRRYRYRLSRAWHDDLFTTPERRTILFVMLNPSTATETEDDKTISKIQGFAKRWGYNELLIGNLFAFRTSDPEIMKAEKAPIGDYNDDHIKAMAEQAEMIVCAWGNDGNFLERDLEVETMLAAMGKDTHCLGLNSNATPKHPLYIKNATAPKPYG